MKINERFYGSNETFEEHIKQHGELFAGSSLMVGKIHWYIQRAETVSIWGSKESKTSDKSDAKIKTPNDFIITPTSKDHKKIIGHNEIEWWIRNRETEVDELLKRTKETLNSAQKLKEDSSSLRDKYFSISYLDLKKKIKEFTETNSKEIRNLYEYVIWLHNKDVLAPRLLFMYQVWGMTRLALRRVKIAAHTIDKDKETVKVCTEIALGFRDSLGYIIEGVFREILGEIQDNIDPEYPGSFRVSEKRLYAQTIRRIFNNFASYFEFIRQSLRNIIEEIKRYNSQIAVLCRESFWKSFMIKVLNSRRIENQLWDFKETLEMWHAKTSPEKEKASVKFCELVAGFSNAKGGVLIIGVTDKLPRAAIGVEDLENKLYHTKKTLEKHIDHPLDFIHFQIIPIKGNDKKEENCLIIATAQTKDVISVKDETGKFSYPIRLETGLHRLNYEEIKKSKAEVIRDNYNFILTLHNWLKDIKRV